MSDDILVQPAMDGDGFTAMGNEEDDNLPIVHAYVRVGWTEQGELVTYLRIIKLHRENQEETVKALYSAVLRAAFGKFKPLYIAEGRSNDLLIIHDINPSRIETRTKLALFPANKKLKRFTDYEELRAAQLNKGNG